LLLPVVAETPLEEVLLLLFFEQPPIANKTRRAGTGIRIIFSREATKNAGPQRAHNVVDLLNRNFDRYLPAG